MYINMQTFFFSIIVPVYNKEKYIENTINSVLSQSYPHFELILVNDGSTDSSKLICIEAAKKDRRVKFLDKVNAGVSSARNLGIEESLYDYIAFLDADDWWASDFLLTINELINQYPDISAFSSQIAWKRNNQIINQKKIFKTQDHGILDLIEYASLHVSFPINSSSLVIKKEIIVKIGLFDEELSFYEDYDFFFRLALCTQLGFYDKKPLSFYDLDVDASGKPRGTLPAFSKHWLKKMDGYRKHYSEDKRVLILLDKFALTLLIPYLAKKEYNYIVKDFLREVQFWTLKFKLFYIFPFQISYKLYTIYIKIRKMI
ncbi:glycosyltransferase family 2 protein [Bacteroides sp. 214]|uniref:glycosyltransferase family 2 protein n=1 Tax=Bacteroides sp. 214 TaxID=2302935 RepID=UPI0013D87304|nr:glycosyltransferase family 2 protein [Bacteroides sp. 214]NDW11789.1 glycosyltransferase family 2 protein [Bacteroides sp. 214]